MTASDALNTPKKSQAEGYVTRPTKRNGTPMQWIGKPVTRLKKEKRVSSKKEKEKNHKVILNALTMGNKNIMRETAIRNPNKTEQPK
jgi:hypothetical protein